MINDNFSLMKGGLVYRFLSAIGALHPDTPTTSWVAAILIGASFLPLLAISAWEGTLLTPPPAMPLLGDYAVLTRFLLAMPLLILAAPWSDTILRGAIRQLAHSDLVRSDRRPPLDAIFARMRRLRDSNLPELLCFVLAIAPALAVFSAPGAVSASDWRTSDPGSLSVAGQWFDLVSVPIFRFVTLIWLWRLCLWGYLLWRLSRIELDLHPAHPDGAAGLGFLGLAQERFGAISASGGFVLLGYCINRILYHQETVPGMIHLLAGYIIGSTLLLIVPLLLVAPKMMASKRHALMKYGALGNRTARAFDRRWRRGEPATDAATLLDQADASGLADFTSVYGTVRSMSIVPVTRWNLLWIAAHAAVPLLPLAFFAMSVDELIRKLFGILA